MPATAVDTSSLPIIDLSKLDNPATREEFYKELRHLAKDIGFFYVIGHGVDPKLREDLLAASKKFFALPQDEKDKIDMANSRHFRGYTKTAVERTRNKPDYREFIEYGQEVPALSQEEIGDKPWLNMIGPNQYPEQVPELKELVPKYLAAARAVTIKLLRAFLVALELPEDGLDELITGIPQNRIKLVRYPGNDGHDGEAQSQGCGPHKDPDPLTLLWQDETGGLQVETKDGWIDVPPVEGSYVINIGETLELATNGYLIANVHQVVMKNHKQDRYSIPFFLGNNLRAERIPLLDLPPHLKAQAQGPTSDPLNPMFYDGGKNSFKSRLRSHRNVTQRFYPEYYELIEKNSNIY